MKIIIRTIEDLDAALPHLLAYGPPLGSVVMVDTEAHPVAVLTPENFDGVDLQSPENLLDLAESLEVFRTRTVVVYAVGWFAVEARDHVAVALTLAGAQVPMVRTLDDDDALALFAGMPTRDDYVASGQRAAALAKADEVARARAAEVAALEALL